MPFSPEAAARIKNRWSRQDVKSLSWHPWKELLVSCSYDDTVKLWTTDGDDWSCAQARPPLPSLWRCAKRITLGISCVPDRRCLLLEPHPSRTYLPGKLAPGVGGDRPLPKCAKHTRAQAHAHIHAPTHTRVHAARQRLGCNDRASTCQSPRACHSRVVKYSSVTGVLNGTWGTQR